MQCFSNEMLQKKREGGTEEKRKLEAVPTLPGALIFIFSSDLPGSQVLHRFYVMLRERSTN